MFARTSILLALLLLSCVVSVPARNIDTSNEYVIVSGGPSMDIFERLKAQPHDRFWGGFIRSARTRMQILLKERPNLNITWLVYRRAYERRSKQEHADLLANITSVRDAYKVNLVYFTTGDDLARYLNNGQPRHRVKLSGFEYFGHSNRACFMFDYSNEIDTGSKSWLHENELGKIRRGLFTKDAFVKSWGCHTGESFSDNWYKATGVRMWGAIGKTDYSNRVPELNGIVPVLSSPGGRWVQKSP